MAAPPSHVIAMYQGKMAIGKENQLKTIMQQMKAAAGAGAELIIFPELFAVGYCKNKEDMFAAAEPKGGESFKRLSKAAKENNIAVAYGYAEVESGIYYNSCLLIDKNGDSLVNYRKLHLWNEPKKKGEENVYESDIFTPGKDYAPVVTCCGMKIGILICFDVEFPENVRILALRGAELVIVPTLTMIHHEYKTLNLQLIPTRARENRIHVAYVNLCHDKMSPGYSVCANPEGVAVGTAGPKESLSLAVVVPDEYKYLHEYLKDRRPSLYKELTKPI